MIASPNLVNHLIELQLLKYSDTLSAFEDDQTKTTVDIDTIYELTDKGRKSTEKWNIG